MQNKSEAGPKALVKKPFFAKKGRSMGQLYYMILWLAVTLPLATCRAPAREAAELHRIATDTTGGTAEQQRALAELARQPGRESARYLLAVALNEGLLIEIRLQAIRSLGQRSDLEDTAASLSDLSRLMQPHVALAIRSAVADAIQRHCPRTCIGSVVHYMERLWRGDPTTEEILATETSQQIKDEQEKVERQLVTVLLDNTGQTIEILTEVHGLGASPQNPLTRPFPSEFALYLVDRMRLRETCPVLKEATELRGEGQMWLKWRERLKSTINSLGCH
jgi:hypothetical protein